MTSLLSTSLLILGLVSAPAETPAAAQDLVAALSDADPDIRALAAGLLADEDEPGARRELSERLSDREEAWRVRVAAAEALARRPFEERSNEALVEVALDENDDWRVRAAAVEALQAGDGGLVLAEALRGAEAPSTVSNGSSTVSLSQPLAEGGILEAMEDPDPRMRDLARAALDLGTLLLLPDRSAARLTLIERTREPCLGETLRLFVRTSASSQGTLTLY